MKRAGLWALLLVLLVPVLAACGGGAKTTEPIRIGGLFDQSGPTADVGVPYSQGVIDYFNYLNEQGGIEGRKIQFTYVDYGYEIPRATEAYKKLVTQDKVIAIQGWGTGDTEAMSPLISKDKIPYMSASYSENLLEIETHPYNFLVGMSYSDQMRLALKWIKDNWTGEGNPKVAFFFHDSAFGRSPIEDGKAFAAEIGVEVVDEEPIKSGTTDTTPMLLNAQKAGATHIVIQHVSGASALILKDLQKLGWTDVQVVGLNWATDEKVVRVAGEAAEGFVGVVPFAFPYELASVSGLKEIKEYVDAKGGNWDEKTQKYVQGWVTAKIMAEGIRRAIKAGGTLDGEAIKKGLETLKDFDTGGITAPVTFTAQSHRGTVEAKIYQVRNGKLVPITDWMRAPGR